MATPKIIKEYALLWSMLIGALLSPWAYRLAWMLPYIMFAMLSLSYTRISPKDLRLRPIHAVLFLAQWSLGLLVYFALRHTVDEWLAQGLALIILTPTAVSASVITAMMGGHMGFVISFLLVGNLAMSLLAPPMLSWLYPDQTMSYLETVLVIIQKISLLLVVPIVLIWSLRYGAPRLHERLARHAGFTFYLWCFSLVIITANTIHFFKIHSELTWRTGLLYGASVGVVCQLLFVLGRKIEHLMGGSPTDVNARQSLGQKNTVLAIWMALTFMHPVVSVIPSFYVIWQNLINSIELQRYRRRTLP